MYKYTLKVDCFLKKKLAVCDLFPKTRPNLNDDVK